MSLKEEFVHFANQPGINRRELMRRFGISAPTGYKWLNRFAKEGHEGLKERSRRPKYHPLKTSEEIEGNIVSLRKSYPYWGARKLRQILIDRGFTAIPSSSTIHEILKRNNLIDQDEVKHPPFKRFERSSPNELWQMDFKGDFAMTNNKRCYPLTICDDHSRYNILIKACENQQAVTVKEQLTDCFSLHGLPDCILCDNGSPWGPSPHSSNGSVIETWLIRLGVNISHGRPYHPQTQGKEERFHRTLKNEVLRQTTVWLGLEHCQSRFDKFRYEYNTIRPHESLGMRKPAELYRPSKRSLPSTLPDIQSYYDPSDVIRKVKSKGEITFKNQSFYIGRGYIGDPVAIKKIDEQIYQIFYCWKSLGYIDFAKITKDKYRYEPLVKIDIAAAAAQQQLSR